METIIINEDNIKPDNLMIKARAIVLNEKNKIYVCNMNDTYVLPGGTIEANELPINTLKRELEEELGLKEITPKELIEIDYYHANFPKYKSDLYENRLNRVYYYLVNINSTNLGIGRFTDYEKNSNIKIEEYDIDFLYKKLKITTNNKYSKFTNTELKIILDYYLNLIN